MAFLSFQNALDYMECGLSKSYSTSTHALGIDLWRGRRCCSGNLQLPPLSQRQTEKARTPDRDVVCRPTTLPLLTPPSIAITTYQDWLVISFRYESRLVGGFEVSLCFLTWVGIFCFRKALDNYLICTNPCCGCLSVGVSWT